MINTTIIQWHEMHRIGLTLHLASCKNAPHSSEEIFFFLQVALSTFPRRPYLTDIRPRWISCSTHAKRTLQPELKHCCSCTKRNTTSKTWDGSCWHPLFPLWSEQICKIQPTPRVRSSKILDCTKTRAHTLRYSQKGGHERSIHVIRYFTFPGPGAQEPDIIGNHNKLMQKDTFDWLTASLKDALTLWQRSRS